MTAILLLGTMLLLLLIGMPVAFAIGLSGMIYLLVTDMRPLILLPQRLLVGMDTYVLIAIPLFTLAGYIMECGGISKRLVDCVEKFFGRVPGSMGMITIVCCTIFAALTGSGPATVAAIGAIMIPPMLNGGYTKKQAAGLLAAGGALGPIIPPSICMIVYGCTMNLSIPSMFAASVLPGLLLALAFIIVNFVIAKRMHIQKSEKRYTFQETARSTWKALGVLFMPVLVLGGIYGGFFTPTEAAVICVVYCTILGFVYRELTIKSLIESMKKTVETSAMILLIVSMSEIFEWILSSARIPTTITEAVVPYLHNKTVYLIILLIILFIAGCFMETLASIVILAPILVPIGIQLGINELHLGVVFCIALVVGFITPPFGVNLFTATGVAHVSFTDVVKGVFPYLIVSMIIVVILAFVPDIILWLPSVMGQ